MKLPDMPYTGSNKKSVQVQFGGYNNLTGAGEGEIADMHNMVSDDYPILSSRRSRWKKSDPVADNGIIFVGDEAYYVNGTTLYHDSVEIGTVANSEKQFSVMPYYLVMMPDKLCVRLNIKGYYNTLAALTAAVTTPEINDIYAVGTAAPYALYYWSGTEWTKNGKEVESLESSWSDAVTFMSDGEFEGEDAANNTIYADTDWSLYFRVGDAVEISGCTAKTDNNSSAIVREISENYLRFYENSFVTPVGSYYYKINSDLAAVNNDGELIEYQINAGEVKHSFTTAYYELAIPQWGSPSGSYYIICPDGEYTFTVSTSIPPFRINTFDRTITYLGNGALVANLTKKTHTTEKLFLTLTNANQQLYILKGNTILSWMNDTLTATYNGVATRIFTEEVTQENAVRKKLTFTAKHADVPESSVTIKRIIPDMDFIIYHGNRLWGCRDDKVYASKLGDPFNFNVFDGLSTDSYAAETGTHGDFTGAVSYLGYPMFFKEDHIFKIYGDAPSEFQIYDTSTNGVKAGSSASLAIAGETLYYHNKAGIMAYAGGTPSLVSAVFGNAAYKNAVGGSDGNKYFVDLTDGAGHHLFIYDPLRQMWHKEESAGAVAILNFAGEAWLYDGTAIETLSALTAPADTTADTVNWMVEFADFTADSPNKKWIQKFQIRCEVTGSMKVELSCDGGGWAQKFVCDDKTKQSMEIPIIPQRADHYRLRLSGTGTVKIYSLAIQYNVGSAQ